MTKFANDRESLGLHPEGGISALRLYRQIGGIDAVVSIIADVTKLYVSTH